MAAHAIGSIFESVQLLAADPILGLSLMFKADSRSQKVNLGVGAYRDSEGLPFPLTSVRDAETLMQAQHLDKEYLPIEGDCLFTNEYLKLIFGQNSKKLNNGEIIGFQTVGATGALRIAADFLSNHNKKKFYVSDPSWPTYSLIFNAAHISVEHYPYYNRDLHQIDFDKMCSAIKEMPPEGVLLLQAGCHNPTGSDLNKEQWKQISLLVKEKHLISFFDFAYQGFDLDPESDAWPIRYFLDEGHEMFVASSCAKNFGMYGERVGMLSIVTHDAQYSEKISSQIKRIIRGIYSTPPLHGERVISAILKNEGLKTEWIHELKNMRDRIVEMRECLAFGLQSKLQHVDFTFLMKQKGLFSLTGLNESQVQELRKNYGVYISSEGRINIAGINMHNLEYILNSFSNVLKK